MRSLDDIMLLKYKIRQWVLGNTLHPILYPLSDFIDERKTRKSLFQVLTFQIYM